MCWKTLSINFDGSEDEAHALELVSDQLYCLARGFLLSDHISVSIGSGSTAAHLVALLRCCCCCALCCCAASILRRALLRDVAWPWAISRCRDAEMAWRERDRRDREYEFEREVIMDTCIGWLLLARRNRMPLRSFCGLYLFLSPICK